MTDIDRDEIPKWLRGPITNFMRLNVNRTYDEQLAAQEEFNKKLLAKLRAANPWGPTQNRDRDITEDEYTLNVLAQFGSVEARRMHPWVSNDDDMPEPRME